MNQTDNKETTQDKVQEFLELLYAEAPKIIAAAIIALIWHFARRK